MSEKKSRLKRQAARAARAPVVAEFNAQRAELVRERDKTLAAAAKTFRDGVEKLQEELADTRRDAWARYDEERLRLIKEYAAKDAA